MVDGRVAYMFVLLACCRVVVLKTQVNIDIALMRSRLPSGY